jgi:ABC-type transport system involved in Fe-S cluster assembly fused permease/ATPase subunit
MSLLRFLKGKLVIVLSNEATSYLDTHAERMIQQAFDNIAKQTTVIVIAYRFFTIVNADCIYVFKDRQETFD